MLYHHACQTFRSPQLNPSILAESVFLQKTSKGTDVGSERYRYTPVPFNALEDASSLASYLLTVRVASEPSGVSYATGSSSPGTFLPGAFSCTIRPRMGALTQYNTREHGTSDHMEPCVV
jgi:hypothetical protein